MTGEDELAFAHRLGSELVRLIRLVERTTAQQAARSGDTLERALYVLLAQLVDAGPQRSRTLAHAVHSDPSTVSRQVGQLVRLGLVERRTDPDDGRACLLAPTTHGAELLHRKRAVRNHHIATMTAHWPAADRDRLVALLARFNTEFEQYRPRMLAEQPEPVPQGGPT